MRIIKWAARALVLAIAFVAITMAMEQIHADAATLPRVHATDNFKAAVMRPGTIYLDDGSAKDSRMKWKVWNSKRAYTSAAKFTTCARSCVTSKASVTIYSPKGKPGHKVFTMMWVHTAGQTFQFQYTKVTRRASSPVWNQTYCSIHDSC